MEHNLLSEAKLKDGQRLLAFNDFFIGVSSHKSARYKIEFDGKIEMQSSSGILISTGAGKTGWLSSLVNMAQAFASFTDCKIKKLPEIKLEDEALYFSVREPFLSKHSGIKLVLGLIKKNRL